MFDELLLLVDNDATSVAPSPPVADSSCLLVRVLLMLITTSGDGAIGTLYDRLVGILVVMLLIRMRSMSIFFIMERSDNDVSEGGSLLPDELTRHSRVCCTI